jgi:hypothetical protein
MLFAAPEAMLRFRGRDEASVWILFGLWIVYQHRDGVRYRHHIYLSANDVFSGL